MTQQAPGRVYLVGAGPGDPALLTLRGAECLRRADVVLYDYLVNPVLVAHCRPEAERICLGKHGGGRIWPQEEINDQLVAHAIGGIDPAKVSIELVGPSVGPHLGPGCVGAVVLYRPE